MKFKCRISVLIFTLLSIYSNAQVVPFISEKSLSPEEKYSIQAWTTENGLPQNSVNSITQTKDGYLWLATFDGLVRFDGLKFKTFNTTNTPEFKSNGIKKLFTDSEDRLWIISSDGNLIEYHKGEFTAHSLPAKLNIEVNVIVDFENESVLVLCSNNKFYRLQNKHFTEISFGNLKKINSIQTLNTNQLYIATENGLYSYINEELSEFPQFKGKAISELYRSPFSEVIVNDEHKLYAVHANSCKFLQFQADLSKLGNYTLGYNDEKKLCVLTENGVLLLSENGSSWISAQSGLSSNSTRSIFVDREKNLWIGTNNGGLNKLKPKLFKAYSKENGMFNDGATAILESWNGSIYIGNNCGGVSEFFRNRFQQRLKQAKDKCVWSLMEDSGQDLWLGTYGGGIYKYDKTNPQNNYTVKDGLSSNVIFSIFQDTKQTVWVGTATGLNSYSGNNFTRVDSSFHHSVTYIYEDKNGELWLCTDIGLATVKNNKIIAKDKSKGFKNTATRFIYEDTEGIFWIGTHGSGLARIKNGKTFYYNDHTTQLDKNVWSIAEDKNGNLWMPSNSGMYVVDKKELNDLADINSRELNPILLSKEDGLKSIEFNGGFQPSMLKSSTGEFWFPTVKGVVVVNPSMLSKPYTKSKIVIEQLLVDEKITEIKDSVVLLADDNAISVSFTSPSFINPSKICFEYKLEGIDNTWISIGTDREVRIKSVPSGSHFLRIRVAGSISTSEVSILINKPLVFWKDPKFITIASLLSVFIILLVTIGAISYVRKRERIKTQINKQYANIELKALQAQMNPHFIFNCLNSIQHFIILNDEVSASKYLTKFSMLMRKFLEHSKSNIVTLQEEVELLRLYVELEALRSKNKFNFTLKIAPEIDIFNIEIPSMLFQPFIENAITHGLLSLERKGTLLLSFELEGNYLTGIIEDDGVGRKKAIEINKNTYKDHASRGMEIIKERIAVLNYIENIQIEVQVIDKMSPEDEPAGTKIIIKIPI
jgi:ligand-binding sensor domain-containing protein